MSIINKIGSFIAALFKGAWMAFNSRDVFVLGGLGMLGYGLYHFIPWTAFAVCGALLMLLGLGWLDRGK